MCVCVCVYIYIYMCVCMYSCLYILYVCIFLAFYSFLFLFIFMLLFIYNLLFTFLNFPPVPGHLLISLPTTFDSFGPHYLLFPPLHPPYFRQQSVPAAIVLLTSARVRCFAPKCIAVYCDCFPCSSHPVW